MRECDDALQREQATRGECDRLLEREREAQGQLQRALKEQNAHLEACRTAEAEARQLAKLHVSIQTCTA